MPTRSILSTCLAAAALVCVRPAEGAGVISIDWGTTGSFQRTVSVEPGRFVEVCGALPAPMSVAWRFEADTALDFNVHYHEGQKVSYPENRKGLRDASGTLAVTTPQEYCWMWTNPSARTTRLQLTLERR
ncbi:hypothetical protein [Ideonella sp.]|uniref:hypothetical protein n=1 Tax=Ideonella sp. TaxID=1929293 RepID=UPI0035B48736